ncbi:MAG TPA: GNAT family protein [Dyella sp.]|uniref:GNAT family N-acetyltransferase n=1 Tax=Dyella sp. TaxID=1869338 RepID=UPI002D775575|nr:GNAT family protein [Dyella sp.]HET6554430.1 GNAT family protein [Dyella sp.]
MELATARLRLDALQVHDAATLFAYRSDPEVARYQGWRPDSLADAERFIRNQIDAPASSPGQWFQRAIRRRSDGALMGDLGCCLSSDGQAEFGITVAQSEQGNGVAREALEAWLGLLFGRLDVHRVHASVDPRNTASMALLRSLGFRQEAHFRESLRFRGEWVDDVIFAMLAREWRERGKGNAGEAASR